MLEITTEEVCYFLLLLAILLLSGAVYGFYQLTMTLKYNFRNAIYNIISKKFDHEFHKYNSMIDSIEDITKNFTTHIQYDIDQLERTHLIGLHKLTEEIKKVDYALDEVAHNFSNLRKDSEVIRKQQLEIQKLQRRSGMDS